MALLSKRLGVLIGALSIFASPQARAQTLTENFSTLDHWDISATQATGSPGVWDANAGQSGNPGPCAMVPVMDNGDVNNAIDFGDGSDGALSSSTGYTFDTSAHPNGYNFTSLNITGGAITVTGTNPLIIRSLTSISITPSILLDGGAGAASSLGGAGGTAPVTSLASGGPGGSTAGGNGGVGDLANGTAGGGSGGAGCASGTCTKGGNSIPTGAPGDFDNGGFIAGGAGGGGGGNSGSATAGGGGGAGGGALQISALGTITVGTISANGGSGGSNGTLGAGCSVTPCSGSGAGGDGGSIWLQGFNGITVGTISANQGSAGLGNGAAGAFGEARGDEPGAPAGWTTGGAGAGGATGGEIPTLSSSGTYYVISTPYDLGTSNAQFNSAPTVTPSSPVAYAASADGTSFTSWTTDITTLSNQSYRYIKFKITLNAATQAYVSSISIPYSGPSLASADLSLAAGCGGIESILPRDGSEGGSNHSDGKGILMTCFWALLYFGMWKGLTASRLSSQYR